MLRIVSNIFKNTAIKPSGPVKQTVANIAGKPRSITHASVPRYIQHPNNRASLPTTASITKRDTRTIQDHDAITINRLKQDLSSQARKNLENFKYLLHRVKVANNEQTLKLLSSQIDNPDLFGYSFNKNQTQELKDEITLRRLELMPEPPSTEPKSSPQGNRIVGNYNRESFKTINAATLMQLAKKLDKNGAIAFYQDIQTNCFSKTLSLRDQNNIRITLLPIIYKKF